MCGRRAIGSCLAALSLLVAGCSEEETEKADEGTATEQREEPRSETAAEAPAAARKKPRIDKPRGRAPRKLQSKDLVRGKGTTAERGDQLTVNYVGVRFSDGKEFDSSFDAGQPFEFELGAGMVIPGWDEGLAGMKVGGRRMLTIPPDKAYGAAGSPPAIGPNETLVFVIDLLAAE